MSVAEVQRALGERQRLRPVEWRVSVHSGIGLSGVGQRPVAARGRPRRCPPWGGRWPPRLLAPRLLRGIRGAEQLLGPCRLELQLERVDLPREDRAREADLRLPPILRIAFARPQRLLRTRAGVLRLLAARSLGGGAGQRCGKLPPQIVHLTLGLRVGIGVGGVEGRPVRRHGRRLAAEQGLGMHVTRPQPAAAPVQPPSQVGAAQTGRSSVAGAPAVAAAAHRGVDRTQPPSGEGAAAVRPLRPTPEAGALIARRLVGRPGGDAGGDVAGEGRERGQPTLRPE